jgi:alkaline phosphatase D
MKSSFLIPKQILAVLAVVSLAIGVSCSQKEDRTASTSVIDRIAFGSCAMQWLEQPIWNVIAESDPDLFLFVGDAIYGDWDGEKVVPATAESLRRDWAKLAAIPEFSRFRERVPVLATWDNHDYGSHNGGAEFELKNASREIFLDFFNEPLDSGRRKHQGIYDSKMFGPEGRGVQIILVDTRYFKGPFVRDERPVEEKSRLNVIGKYAPNKDPDAKLLGDDQWRWLEAELRKAAEVRFIVSGTQIIPDEKGMDEWGNYPHERRRLFDSIGKTGANGVILLTGNVHFTEVSALDTHACRLVEFTSSGLTHVNERYAEAVNSYRVAGPYADLNFGVVEIDWEKGVVTLKAVKDDGEVAFQHAVNLNQLRSSAQKGD